MLREARQRARLSVRAAAERAGISAGYLGNLEGGQRCPSRTVAARLTDALELDDRERAVVLAGSVADAGLDHPWRRSFGPRKLLP